MKDPIERQAAIDRAVSIPMFGRDVKMVAVSEIKDLPSARPERKKGKWVQDGIASNVFRCSECGCDAPVEPTGGCEFKSNYCYYCGADMRGEQE